MYWKRSSLLAELADVGQLVNPTDYGFAPGPGPSPIVLTPKAPAGPTAIMPPGFFDPLTGQFMPVQPGVATGIQAPPITPSIPVQPAPKPKPAPVVVKPKPIPMVVTPITMDPDYIKEMQASVASAQKALDYAKQKKKKEFEESAKKSEADLDNQIKIIKAQAPPEKKAALIAVATDLRLQKSRTESQGIQAARNLEKMSESRLREAQKSLSKISAHKESMKDSVSESLDNISFNKVSQPVVKMAASPEPSFWDKLNSAAAAAKTGATNYFIDTQFESLINKLSGGLPGPSGKVKIRRGLRDDEYSAAEWSEIEASLDLAHTVHDQGMMMALKGAFGKLPKSIDEKMQMEIKKQVESAMGSKYQDQIKMLYANAIDSNLDRADQVAAAKKLKDVLNQMKDEGSKIAKEKYAQVSAKVDAGRDEKEKLAALARIENQRKISQQEDLVSQLQAAIAAAQKPNRRYSDSEEDFGASMEVGNLQQKLRDATKKLNQMKGEIPAGQKVQGASDAMIAIGKTFEDIGGAK